MTNSTKRRIFLIDDHPIVRRGMVELIGSDPQFQVCGEAASWAEAMSTLVQSAPDAVVLDISLGDRMGLDLVCEMLSLIPNLRILVLSMHDESIFAERALRAGAHGYVMKVAASQKVLEALHTVLSGQMYLAEGLYAKILGQLLQPRESKRLSGIDSLTNRELEILNLIGQGLSTDAIADRLHLSPKTIEVHRSRIRSKLQLSPEDRLVEVAIRMREGSAS
jgi:DNA-binding NarL/FixJ family response regulator